MLNEFFRYCQSNARSSSCDDCYFLICIFFHWCFLSVDSGLLRYCLRLSYGSQESFGGRRMLDTGYWIQDARCRIQDAGKGSSSLHFINLALAISFAFNKYYRLVVPSSIVCGRSANCKLALLPVPWCVRELQAH